ncbi:MAG: hypothetical protein E6R13_00615 [Spirochaetes bacterium]|nr:MAG: hypothetical protein E6R13_00615 [Spirochaetota bacterium]
MEHLEEFIDIITEGLKSLTPEEKAIVIEQAMKKMDIGISFQSECTDSGKYCEFTFTDTKLIYLPGKFSKSVVLLTYLQTEETFMKLK